MDKKDEAIAKLYKIAKKQQELLKRAQVNPGNLNPQEFALNDDVTSILELMDPVHKPSVKELKVEDGVVKVQFNPGMGSDEAFEAVQLAVVNAAELNKLPRSNYQIQEVL